MQYRTLRLQSLFLFCTILFVAPSCEAWQIPRVAAVNVTPALSVSPSSATTATGETVNFTAVLQPAFRDAVFWFDWGDRTPASTPSVRASASHVFPQAGAFQVVAHARFSNRIINSAPVQITVKGSLAGDVLARGAQRVNPAVEIGQATTTTTPRLLLKASNTEPRANDPVIFVGTLQPDPRIAVQYQFKWGDGGSSDWTSSPTAIHSFSSPGSYPVVLVVRAAVPAAAAAPRQLQSEPVTIRVQPPVVAPRPTLLLRANQQQPTAGQTVVFTGSLQPATSGPIQYFFDWGDSTTSGWGPSASASHSFAAERTYIVILAARIGDPIEGAPQMLRTRLAINVQPAPVISHNLVLTSNASQLQVGQAASFSGTLSPPAARARYRFLWGDQTVSNVTPDPSESHAYSAPGSYRVVLVAQVGAEQIQSNTVAIEVRNITVYRLDLTTNTTEIAAGRSVNFTARLEPLNDAASYVFVWDDGTPATTTGLTTVPHAFMTAGSHTVSVNAIVDDRKIPGNPVSVTVLPPPNAVSLSANSTRPEVNQIVEFHASILPENIGAEYQFNWGDGAISSWSSSPNQTHNYTSSGPRSAFVTARAAGISVQSAALPIAVQPVPSPPPNDGNSTDSQIPPSTNTGPTTTRQLRPLPTLVLSADKTSVNLEESVKVIATFGSAEPPEAEYKFIFADDTPPVWSRTPVVMHQFQKPGAYIVKVFGRTRSPEYEPNEKPGNTVTISVLVSPPTPWDKLAIALLFTLGMAGTTWRTFARVRVRVKPTGAPAVRVIPGPIPVPAIRVRVVLGEVNHQVARYKEAVNKR
jgi:hypothetical protein